MMGWMVNLESITRLQIDSLVWNNSSFGSVHDLYNLVQWLHMVHSPEVALGPKIFFEFFASKW